MGRFDDGSGVTHAFLLQMPNTFLVYDFPGATTLTSFNGINRGGVICGRYEGSDGIGHGIVARIKRGTASTASEEMRARQPAAPARRIIPVPSAPRGAAPPS